jgi:hypothetical protein
MLCIVGYGEGISLAMFTCCIILGNYQWVVEMCGNTYSIFKIGNACHFVFFHKQAKKEGTLFTKFKINLNFGKLISAIIQKSWPKDSQGRNQEEEVFRHILSWTAAKDVFKLLGKHDKQCTVYSNCLSGWQWFEIGH